MHMIPIKATITLDIYCLFLPSYRIIKPSSWQNLVLVVLMSTLHCPAGAHNMTKVLSQCLPDESVATT